MELYDPRPRGRNHFYESLSSLSSAFCAAPCRVEEYETGRVELRGLRVHPVPSADSQQSSGRAPFYSGGGFLKRRKS